MIEAVLPDEATPLPPMWEKRLLRLEERVTSSESDGLRARWDFGRELLSQRRGKTLPRYLIDRVATAVGVSRQELQARMKFAERYPDPQQLSDAVRQFPSWHAMSHEGLRRAKAERKPVASEAQLALRHAGRLAEKFGALAPEEIGEPERAAIQALTAVLTHLVAALEEGYGRQQENG